jgi:3-oxoadipate enol-lactonase
MAYVRTRLGRLFYEERGEGPRAIVLLHELMFDGGMWNDLLEPLAKLGRVVVLDGPGHGKSEPAPRFMLEDHADALFDAFGELGIRDGVFVGLSWGAMVAMRVALQHAERVRGLALLDGSAESEPLRNVIRYRALIAMHRRVGLPYALYRRRVAPLLFSQRVIETRAELVEASYRRSMGFARDGLARAALAVVVHRKNVLPSLSRIDAPTLVMCGTEDRAQPPERSRVIADAIARAELALLDGLGHMSVLEDARAVEAKLVPFVERCLRA